MLFQVDESAIVLNFVVHADGMYDNNNGQDYKALVELPEEAVSLDAWHQQVEDIACSRIRKDRLAAEQAHRLRMEKRAQKRNKILQKSLEVAKKQVFPCCPE